MPTILADTSALYALLDQSDQHHQEAARFYYRLPLGTRLIVIEYVLVELMTLLRKRGLTSIAIQFRERLLQSNIFVLHHSSPKLEREAFSIFRNFSDKNWSYTDCALYAIARRFGNAPIFSFDHHIVQMGLIRLP